MSSEIPTRAFVWVWLPGAGEPVVAGALDLRGELVTFVYGRSYLERSDALPLYLPELPLRRGRILPVRDLTVAGCVADAGPDAWGQRIVAYTRLGRRTAGDATNDLTLLTYLLESGSDRIGALDFQESSDNYVARYEGQATLDEVVTAAERLERGERFTPALDLALLHGSSIGGARPKALLDDGERRFIAKFSSSTDPYPVVKAEAAAMYLARLVGLDVAPVEMTTALGRDVLLVERFDRPGGGERAMMVSALTMLELPEHAARYATYHDLADLIRKRFTDPKLTLRELFSRIIFNICVSNTDDHARNHAAFWDGHDLALTPAYDLCPQSRSGGEATQAMAIGRDGYRFSNLAGCAERADLYLISESEARDIIDNQVSVIRAEWATAADFARLTEAERDQMWGRQILNPYALEDTT
jgi:serine/threonine-protein kinase HipA